MISLNIALAVTFLVTLVSGVPVAFCLALTSLVFLLLMGSVPLHLIPQRMFTGMDSFPVMAVPFFILAGDLMNAAGITEKIVRFASVLVGHIRGGLAHVNIVASMFFAGVSGSAVADAAALGSILIPAMEEDGYDKTFAAAVTASAAVIGPIIPPSIPVVIYALSGSLSIGGLFLAGVLPGVLIGLGLMLVAYVIARRHNIGHKRPRAHFKEFWVNLKGAVIPLLMPVIILGGILGGVFTPTEASCVAVAYAILIGMFVLRTIKFRDLPPLIYRSMLITATILMVMACANIFSWILGTQQIPQAVGAALTSFTKNPYVFLLLVNLFLLVVGCFLEGIAAIVLIVPILIPVAQALGISQLHFGMVVIMNLMIGLITPPLGLCLFVCCSVARVDFTKLIRASFPFLAIEIVALFIVTYVPFFTLFIPSLFGFR